MMFTTHVLSGLWSDNNYEEIKEINSGIVKVMERSPLPFLLLNKLKATFHVQNSCLFTNKGHFSSPLWV